jgi:hypothetical protein
MACRLVLRDFSVDKHSINRIDKNLTLQISELELGTRFGDSASESAFRRLYAFAITPESGPSERGETSKARLIPTLWLKSAMNADVRKRPEEPL